mgnify:CR=1 FL=1
MVKDRINNLVHKPTNSIAISTGVIFPTLSLIIFSS